MERSQELVCEFLSRTGDDPLHLALFSKPSSDALERRIAIWLKLQELNPRPVSFSLLRPYDLWRYPLALSQYVYDRGYMVVGVAGPPGVGKTTLVGLMKECLRAISPQSRVLAVSMDDFVFSKAERAKRNIRHRAQPGSHDLICMESLIRSVRMGAIYLEVPRFDAGSDDVLPPEPFEGPVSILLLDGWFVGTRLPLYRTITDSLDYLIYLDCSLEFSKARRFHRERLLREEKRGFSDAKMDEFWSEVLEPGIDKHVRPVARNAQIRIYFSDTGDILSVS
jgi:pantothenate kinase